MDETDGVQPGLEGLLGVIKAQIAHAEGTAQDLRDGVINVQDAPHQRGFRQRQGKKPGHGVIRTGKAGVEEQSHHRQGESAQKDDLSLFSLAGEENQKVDKDGKDEGGAAAGEDDAADENGEQDPFDPIETPTGHKQDL